MNATVLQDQKVSWHATPFEERLEKALSEDNFISQRYDMLLILCSCTLTQLSWWFLLLVVACLLMSSLTRGNIFG